MPIELISLKPSAYPFTNTLLQCHQPVDSLNKYLKLRILLLNSSQKWYAGNSWSNLVHISETSDIIFGMSISLLFFITLFSLLLIRRILFTSSPTLTSSSFGSSVHPRVGNTASWQQCLEYTDVCGWFSHRFTINYKKWSYKWHHFVEFKKWLHIGNLRDIISQLCDITFEV